MEVKGKQINSQKDEDVYEQKGGRNNKRILKERRKGDRQQKIQKKIKKSNDEAEGFTGKGK